MALKLFELTVILRSFGPGLLFFFFFLLFLLTDVVVLPSLSLSLAPFYEFIRLPINIKLPCLTLSSVSFAFPFACRALDLFTQSHNGA